MFLTFTLALSILLEYLKTFSKIKAKLIYFQTYKDNLFKKPFEVSLVHIIHVVILHFNFRHTQWMCYQSRTTRYHPYCQWQENLKIRDDSVLYLYRSDSWPKCAGLRWHYRQVDWDANKRGRYTFICHLYLNKAKKKKVVGVRRGGREELNNKRKRWYTTILPV